ncbi:MAG: hypothetical protein A3F84_27680 [Candidatus Handelsmanbacteria bacterium RIFCSPLOWO2_12_FULL_64_10]|uniref:Uncharacterized protein n=1 Tax=Handelsmanbacteria sp. (strain RIFCSPLOWO2_12_FULL_64_10) TaxID=1817868 RepID=A0A1F6C4H6_HANXR|nr:MAG: hypothetical protein A3F84_27680 [Candidatus Handelsmanbacteria bacterium RIFCSPLOWO2_12_FULL_64_10]
MNHHQYVCADCYGKERKRTPATRKTYRAHGETYYCDAHAPEQAVPLGGACAPTAVQVKDAFGKPALLFGLPIFVTVEGGDVAAAEQVARGLAPESELRN